MAITQAMRKVEFLNGDKWLLQDETQIEVDSYENLRGKRKNINNAWLKYEFIDGNKMIETREIGTPRDKATFRYTTTWL